MPLGRVRTVGPSETAFLTTWNEAMDDDEERIGCDGEPMAVRFVVTNFRLPNKAEFTRSVPVSQIGTLPRGAQNVTTFTVFMYR